jgi:signal peptidase II
MDRVRLGAVVDFLDVRVWPVFNFADTAISIGVGLFLWEIVFDKKRAPSDVS